MIAPGAILSNIRYALRQPLAAYSTKIAIFAVAILVVTIIYWWPAQHRYAQLVEDTAVKRRELVQNQQAEELLRNYAHAKQEVPLLEEKLKQAVSQAQLVENIAQLANKHGVKILGENFEETNDTTDRSTWVSELSVQGSYSGLRGFLQNLSSLPTWTEVQEVRIESAHGSSVLKGRMRLITYRGVSNKAGLS